MSIGRAIQSHNVQAPDSATIRKTTGMAINEDETPGAIEAHSRALG